MAATTAASRRAEPGLGRHLLLGGLLVVLTFGVVELGLRAWVYLIRDPPERFDVTTGTFVLVPGTHPRAGLRPLQINTRGFVGAEFTDPAPPGVVRIVTLGDSCTFGGGSARDAYPGLLELRLNRAEAAAPRYQVINAAIRGLNTDLARRRLVSKVLPLSPDVVTVYVGWNDLMKFEPGGQVEQPGIAILARALDHLWLTKAMRKVIFYYLRPLVWAPATGAPSRTGRFHDYRPAVFEEALRTLIRPARAQGARVVVMTLPSVVSDDMTAEDLRSASVIFPYYASAYGVGDLVDLIAAYNRSIRTVAGEEGVLLVDLAAELDARPDRRRLFFDTMHPSQRGRELIADILASRLTADVAAAHGGARR
jgi:lysophospholipase L1-like esterase